jgi:uncharacterized protein YecT (DUF1311 family)
MKLFLFAAALAATSAFAQYDGPAVESCRTYAQTELKRAGGNVKEIVIVRDRNLFIERYTRKIGSQFVSSVLSGNGSIVYPAAPSAELSFLCLLADDKHPIFFNWLPRQDTSALAQCTRDESLPAKPRGCLEMLQQIAESELGQMYAERFQEANARDEAAVAAYRRSNDAWRQYRDAECERQGAGAEERKLACIVDLTRRRAWDMR